MVAGTNLENKSLNVNMLLWLLHTVKEFVVGQGQVPGTINPWDTDRESLAH